VLAAATGDLTSCNTCHPETVDPAGKILVAGGKHINGVKDVGSMACGSCHKIPPATTVHAKVTVVTQCATCHSGTIDASGALKSGGLHANGTVDVQPFHPAGWGPTTGTTNDHQVAANQGVAACVACHGDISGTGGYVNIACATCHNANHSYGAADFGTAAAPSCTGCHGNATVTALDGSGVSRAPAPPRATSGTATATNPRTANGGAHAKHLTPGTLFAASAYACAQCHATPAQPLHASGAVDLTWGSTAAPTAATKPAYDPVANTCASTWCHGNIPNGNARTMTWTDTGTATCGTCHGLPPGGTHPTLAATQNCKGCHPAYDGLPGGTITILDPSKHLNGVIDSSAAHAASAAWADPSQHGLSAIDATYTGGQGPQACTGCHVAYGSAGTPTAAGVTTTDCNACHAANGHPSWKNECTFCHGGQDNTTGAPARDHTVVRGTTQATTLVTVGAHTSHVAASHAVDAALACVECHTTPTGSVDATAEPGHIDGATATLVWGATSKLASAAPSWNRTAATCASTYCHGATLSAVTTQGTATRPLWTKADGSQATCGSCHRAPPGTANHHNAAALTTCVKCHGATGCRGRWCR
jgi:predicted CxxxxCH...CXXCH cytochrome family protein